jgi:tRNA(fMet)-specific endonuclease VapC
VEIAFCLDTSAYSHFARGNQTAVEFMRTATRIVVPVVVLAELRAGFSVGNRATENEQHLRKFLANSVVEVADVNERVASIWAEIWKDQRRRGLPVGTNDMWIAATAAAQGLSVLTADVDFANIARVSCEMIG